MNALFPLESIVAHGMAYIGSGTILRDPDGNQIIYIGPTAEALAESLKKTFPEMEFDQTKFLKLAIFKTS